MALSAGLERAYARLFARWAGSEFQAPLARTVLGGSLARTNMLLSRLVRRHWAVRVERGTYLLLRPIAPLSEAATDWTSRVGSSEVRDLLRLALSHLDGALGDRLLAVALYGSYARGGGKPESDVDLLVMVGGPPPSLEERVELGTALLRATARRLAITWARDGLYPQPEATIVTREELARGSAFLLDLGREAVILLDRGHELRSLLTGFSRRAQGLGARRAETPDGAWYWEMPRGTGLASLGSG